MILVATALLVPISPAHAEPGDAGTSGPLALDATFVGTQLRQVDYVEGSTGTPIATEAYAYDKMGRVATRCGPSDDPTCVDGGAFSPSTVWSGASTRPSASAT